LPFNVLGALQKLRKARDFKGGTYGRSEWVNVPDCYDFDYGEKLALEESGRVLESIGGVKLSPTRYEFDYDPLDVIQEIVASGCLPDQKAHQFYPTPEKLARIAVELADIGPGDECLEPSAGMGGLADLMPEAQTVCVEISPLHCKVLESKGHLVQQADFLAWTPQGPFDRIVMNPPFSSGRWEAHTEHAATMLRPGGRLVAILPASAKNKEWLPGLSLEWHGPYENEFAGTSVSVVILVADKAAP
jgi:hypothetical protein